MLAYNYKENNLGHEPHTNCAAGQIKHGTIEAFNCDDFYTNFYTKKTL